MSQKSLAQLFRRWVARGNRAAAPRPTARLRLEEVEHRLVPATTPGVTVAAATTVPNTAGTYAPQVVADPTNPNTLAMVTTATTGIIGQISYDGGTTWSVFLNNQSGAGNSSSGGKLTDPAIALNAVQNWYTNVSEATITFTRSGSIYLAYLQHNAAKTSGALVVDRFDLDRTTQSLTRYDLDPRIDWDNDPTTPGAQRWSLPRVSASPFATSVADNVDNRTAVLYRWTDDGTNLTRPANPYLGVDTNLASFTDPTTGQTVTDPFVSAGGGDTLFVAWNMVASAPVVTSGPGGYTTQPLVGFTPNAVMVAVGRADPQDTRNRPDPDQKPADQGGPAFNVRTPYFEFSTPVPVNDGIGASSAGLGIQSGGFFMQGVSDTTGGAAPVVNFTPASLRPNGTVAPGQVTVTWSTVNGQIAQSTTDLTTGPTSASYTFRSNNLTASTGFIADGVQPPQGAPNGTADSPGVTEFQLPDVRFDSFSSFTTLDDLDVTVALSHPNLSHLRIELVAPDNTTVTLVNNRIDGLGQARGPFNGVTPGLAGTDLGVLGGTQGTFGRGNAVPGNAVGTVFSQEAARNIEDPNNPANYVASYRPEAGSLAAFYGRSAAQLNDLAGANWKLRVTDVRDDRLTLNNNPDTPVQFLRFWSLTFTSRLDNSNTTTDSTATAGRLGADRFVSGAGGAALPVGSLAGRAATVGFGADQTFPNKPAASPTFGVGPGVAVAYDTSLGSFSQYGGRMYVAYTGGGGVDTNIFLVRSDDNGLTWSRPVQVNDDAISDNFSEGTRTQFQPSVTVDPVTGTVVVMWYDARQDASVSRTATYVATSIDGGVTFSPSRPVNATKTAVDAITGATVKLESVPSNFQGFQTNNAGSAFQYGGAGIRQAVVAYGGVIRPFYTGNLNANGSSVLTATVLTAAGPRVVGSDMGSVTEQSVDTDALGNQLQTGAIQVRDEDNFAATIRDAFGLFRTQYNDQFAPDGTRLIDGFRVVFDRPVYFGTGATQDTAVADPSGEGFDASDVTVRFRGTAGLLDTGTQGALVPLKGVVPIGGYSANGSYFATAYFVQFATPQSAAGTYSYAVSPAVSDRVRSVAGAAFRAADTPLAIPDFPGAGAASTIIVPPAVNTATNVAALAQNLLVGLSVTHRDLSDLTATLTHTLPDGTTRSAVLFNAGDLFGTSLQNMRFSDAGGSVFAALSPTYTGVFQPAQSFAAAFGTTPLAGLWTLTVTDTVAALTGTLDSWRVESLTAPATAQFDGTPTGGGTPVAVTRTGNGLDQDADATQREAANDTYSAPGSLSGAPFTGPYDTNTRPLIAPGPHVVHVYPGGQQATAVTAVINNFSASALDVTLDREVDATTLPGNVTVVGPTGPITPTSVTPTGVINGATKTFTLTFASALPGGSYKVTLNNKVYVTDDTVLSGTTNEVFVRFDRDINPASFTPANVLRVTGPSGPLSLTGVTVTPVAEDRTPLPANAATARLFRVTFDQAGAVLAADAPTIGFSFDAPPTAPLTINDVQAVIGPNGPVSLAGATLTGSGTSYTLTFPAAQPKGPYTIQLNPTPSRVTATQPAASPSLPFTLSAVPPSGQLTLADIASVTGPNGAVSLAGASLTGSGTSYTLTLASAQPAGVYTINLSPTAVRRIEVHGAGAVLSGGYTIEFGSNPAQSNDYLAAIRSADRPQLVTARTAASNTLDIPLSSVNGLLSKNDVVRIIGPNGPVDVSAATLSGPVTSNGVQTYTLTFPAPLPAGQYVVDFDPSAARNIRVAGSGLPIDQNFNAGLDLVTGRSAAGTATVEQVYASTSLPVAITPGTDTGTVDGNGNPVITPSVATMSITITDDFVITQDALNKVEVLLNIKHPNDRDLTIELVPPAASGLDPVLLYNGADATPFQTGKTKDFNYTRLVDRVGDPNFPSILLAQPDYFAGATSGFTPQSPLSVLADPNKPVSAKGTWTLRVTNHGTNQIPPLTSYPAGTPIQITGWQLSLPRAIPGTGLGERGADRFQAGFKVFNLDPLDATSHTDWTPVGPASANETANSGRVTSVAVDPSDPSGNTVYVAGASGGVWKSTNFLTSDIDGPHFVPLTDFGPSLAVNIQSLALFPRNNDPGQTIVFALTGEGNNLPFRQGQYTAAGVGVLRSTDGGKTWAVLDSTNNQSSDPSVPPGTVGKVSDPARDRTFVGASGFKIVVDPNPAPDGGVIVYMAVSVPAGGNANAAGLWRSLNGGLTWTRIRAGNATDVVLAAGSANTADPITRQTVNNGNLQRLYAAFQADGVYYTDSAPSASGLILMDGQGGLPSTADVAFPGTPPVTVQNTPNPNGGNGRIALAAPALTADPVRNSFYKDWLYAAVVAPNGTLSGLYQTKDAGKNWTLVKIPTLGGWGTNNENDPVNRPALDPLGLGQGNYNLTLAVDPSNPAVVYLAGLGASGTGSIKLDLTKIKDAQNFTFFNNGDLAGGFQTATTGGAVARVGVGPGAVVRGGSNSTYATDFLNISRDPNNPFVTNSTVRVSNIGSVVNDGSDVFWQPFTDVLGVGDLRAGKSGLGAVSNERESAVQVHSIFPFLDPVSGKTRFIYGTDMGVFTGVDASDTVGTGTLHTAVGFDRQVAGSRNGDLQLTQFYSGAVQPSQLAADVAGALFYSMADANGFVVSDPRIVSNGNTDWRGPEGDGAWVEVDATGNGYSFQYRSPVNDGFDNNTTALPKDFFRVFLPNTDPEFSGGIGRTFGLIQNGDNPGFNVGQWPANPEALGFKFAVNPVNPNVLVITSNVGRVFRTTDQGATWLPIGQPGQLDGTGPGAQAFGAADPNNPALTNNFIYVGTAGGRVFVTTTGGGTWTNVTVGSLDGSPIQRIVPNPAAGSREVYLVTERGVYYKADGTDNTTPWVNITGGLFNVKRAAFGDTQDQFPALPQAGRALNALAVDWRFANAPGSGVPGAPVTTPDLYVGGVGGVFKSSDFGNTWRLFPDIATDGALADGGYMPSVEVTDLDLSVGNIDPRTGKYQAGGLNLLLASTYGRGSYAIRLGDALQPQSFIKGPQVTAVINPNTPAPPSSPQSSDRLDIQFSGPVDPATLKPENFQLLPVDVAGNPTGAPVQILSVTPVTGSGIANRYEIAFVTQTRAANGAPTQYRLTVGYNADGSGVPTITDPSGFRMDQDGDTTNGEPVVDQFIQSVTLNGASNSLVTTASPAALVAGVPGTVTIRERDASGNTVNDNGTLTITSTGPGPVVLLDQNGNPLVDNNGNPVNTVRLVSGVATFQVQMTVAGAYTVAATTGVNVNPTSFNTTVTAAAAASVTLVPGQQTTTSGGAVTYTLGFQDQYGNTAAYAGTATITYGGAAVDPASPTSVTVNTATNQTSFTVTTKQSGTATVTATMPKPGGGTLTSNTANITVNPGAATTVLVTPSAGPYVVGQPVTVTVRVTDANGNLANVSGPLSVNPGSDPGAVVNPTTPQLTNGTGTFTVTYQTPGQYPIVVTAPGGVSGSTPALTVGAVPPRPSPTETLTGVYAAATGVDGNPTVTVFNPDGSVKTVLTPFPAGYAGEVDAGSVGFTGGIRVSVADVTGDKVPDYVVGTGPTITATVLVIDGATNRTVLTLRPFADFKGGVFVSTGDIDGDGTNDIVITPDQGGGPRVTVLQGGTFRQIANFYGIDDPNFRGGARAAMGDINGDGYADLVVAAGFGGGPRISIYDGAALAGKSAPLGTRLNVVGDFFAFEQSLRNGTYVSVGDVNGDGLADVIIGAGPGGGPRAIILDSATLLTQGSQVALLSPIFNAYLGDPETRGGVRVAAKNIDGDKYTDLVVGPGEGGGSRVDVYSGKDFSLLDSTDLLPGYTGGVFVG